jgi:hypothetical protein
VPSLRSLFHPMPTAPPTLDTSNLASLTDLELRARLEAISVQRRAIAEDHAAGTKPRLDRREKLMAEVGKIDGEIAWLGIGRQDAERQCDKDVQAVQAELRSRVAVGTGADDDADVVVDQSAVDRLVDQMLSGKRQRSDFVAASDVEVQAQIAFDAFEQEAAAWIRQVAQIRRATGRTPEKPASLERFDDDVLKEIARRQGVAL